MLKRCCNLLVRHYSRFLYNYTLIFLIVTPFVLVLCAIFSFVPAVSPELPNFSEPTEGFEPRGTDIMKRVITHQETLEAATKDESLTCKPTANINKITRRSTSSVEFKLCEIDTYKYFSVKTIYESGADLFNVDDLKTICLMEERIVRSTPGFLTFCACHPVCGSSLSLGTYIASIRNHSSCHDITKEDVNHAKNLLETCASAYFNGQLSNNPLCNQNKDFITYVFDYLVDKEYLHLRSTKILKNTMVLSPSYYDVEFAREIYNLHLTGSRPEQNGIKLVAFQFDNFKFDQFNQQLLLDAVFPALGLVMVALILLIYTNSFLVMGLTVFSVITSVIIAYFIYHQIFRLTFFPFLNILTFIFLVGIGADDAFVFSDVWAQAKLAKPNGSITDWIEYTLSHAILSMFVTSLTTSAAFYANVVSSIAAIRLFGIYAGTSILIMFSLMITWFPAGVVFLEKRRFSRATVKNVELQENPMTGTKLPPFHGDETPQYDDEMTTESNPCEKLTEPSVSDNPSDTLRRFNHCCRYYNIARTKCSNLMSNLFEKWIPTCLRGYPILLIAFLALGIGMICAMTVNPGLQRPKSSDFQVFSSSHILEQYDLKYKKEFRLDSTASSHNFVVYIFFGLRAEDNGNHLEPKNFGKLSFDDSLDIFLPKAQQWFLVDLCSEIKKQKFFGKNFVNWRCYPSEFNALCSQVLNKSLPFNESEILGCFNDYYKYLRFSCDKYHSGLFFSGSKVKGISLSFPTNIPYTNEYSKVDEFWDEIENFERNVLAKAPKGMKNGWATSWLRFYALQRQLGTSTIQSLGVSLAIAFCVILLTSLNWVISMYAIVTIICILGTTIGSLVLAGWELNILESIVISVAVGLSVDFTLHYGVAYTVSSENGRINQVKYALRHIGPAVTMAAVTTFIAGVFMMFSTVLAYFQLGQFLTLVMAISWLFATFFFMSLCCFAGPVGHFGQINSKKCISCKVSAGQHCRLE